MTYPKTIEEVEALEETLNRHRIDLNCYWHLTTQMKIAIAVHGDKAQEHVAKLMRGFKVVPKRLYTKPLPPWKKRI
ncbi:hypothetical protein [Sulfurovum sp.]|uniref:hypothetical protein n=1 Tax=Sulfurovum sp. TaxID=1969726 RepID=UPI003564CBB1